MITVVDDDESVRDSIRMLLRSVGHRVATFNSAAGLLLDSGAIKQTACLILDVRMPGMDGLELQRRLNAARSRIPIIFITAHPDEFRQQQAIAAGAIGFLCKPFEPNMLLGAVQAALQGREVQRSAQGLGGHPRG
jgi:two-component system response regulator FixJ